MKRKMIFLLAAMMVATVGYAQRPHQRSLQSEQAKVVKKAKQATSVNVAGAITIAEGLSEGEITTEKYAITGYVINPEAFNITFGNQTFFLADDKTNSGSQTFKAYRCLAKYKGFEQQVLAGDEVTVTGYIQNYNGTPEVIEGVVTFENTPESENATPEVKVIHASEALTIGTPLNNNDTTDATYLVVGYVSSASAYDAGTSAQTFWITDTYTGLGENTNDAGAFCAYRAKVNAAVQVGDRVIIRTRIYKYTNGTIESAGAGLPASIANPKEINCPYECHIEYYQPDDYDWEIYAFCGDSAYVVDVYSNNAESPAGTYDVSAFNAKYSGVWDNYGGGDNQLTRFVEAEATIVETATKITIEASCLGTDGQLYIIKMHKYKDITLYYVNTNSWADVYTYLWDNGGNEIAVWSGVSMTNTGDVINGYDIYSYTLSGSYVDYENIIFNDNNGTQTADLKWDASKPYYYEGEWYASLADIVAPTPTDLANMGYDLSTEVVLCVHFSGDAKVLFDVYFVGTFTDWALSTAYQFADLTPDGFPGWYAASAPADNNGYSYSYIAGKPLQTNNKGCLLWDFQPGDAAAWKYIGGSMADIKDESEIGISTVNFSTAGAYIYELSYWKNHKNPIVKEQEIKHNYTFNVYPPVCTSSSYDLAITGTFNCFAETLPMTSHTDSEGRLYYSYTINDGVEGQRIQFYEAYNYAWDNYIEVFNLKTMQWEDLGDIYLPASSEPNVEITLDLSDPYHRWKSCESQTVAVVLTPPADVPEAGIDIMGSFDSWTDGVKLEEKDGAYVALLTGILPYDEFKFREAGTWVNEPMFLDTDDKWYVFANMVFQDYWQDGAAYGYPGFKYIAIDLSDPAKYKWKLPLPTCHYNLVLTDRPNDGWDGGGKLLVKDGDFTASYSCLSGESPKTIKVPYYGNEVTFTWMSGSWTDENSITILASNEMGLFEHPQGVEMADGELLYTMKASPCISGANPFIPKNIQTSLTEENRLRVTWDAIEGIPSYQISIFDPNGTTIANNAEVSAPAYVSSILTLSGEYTITIRAIDADRVPLGMSTITADITPVVIPNVEISIFTPTDCNVDFTDGAWLQWRAYGATDWTTVKMDKAAEKLYTASFEPNAAAYDYRVINKESDTEAGVVLTYAWTGRTTTTHCSEVLYAADGYPHSLRMHGDCAFTDHDYAIKSATATAVPGAVQFSWTATDIDDEYYIAIYRADNNSNITGINVYGAMSTVWNVDDSYDGVEIKWYVYPYSPYSIAEFYGNNVTLEKANLSLVSGTVTTSDNKKLTMEWEFSTACPYYLVELMEYGTVIYSEITDQTTAEYTSPFYAGNYTECYVTPLDATKAMIGQRTYIDEVDLDQAGPAIDNIQGTADGKHITFTWTGSAPKVKGYISLRRSDKTTQYIVAVETTAQKTEFDVEEDGEYILYIRPYRQVGTEYVLVGNYVDGSVLVFTHATYTVDITASTGGYIDPSGWPREYAEGYNFTIAAYEEDGYYFEKWSDGETNNVRSIYVSGDINLQAIFKQLRTLTVSANDAAYGYVQVSDYYDNLGSGKYAQKQDAAVTLTAVPNAGYKFDKWSDDVLTMQRVVTMSADVTLEAQFSEVDPGTPQYDVDISSEDVNKGTVNNVSGLYYEGSIIEVTATPKTGYVFVKWDDDDTHNPRTFTVTGDINRYAIFDVQKLTLSVSAGEGGTVDPSGSKQVAYGTVEVIKAIANTGFEFKKWSDGNPLAERQITVVQDCTLIASFQALIAQYTFALEQKTGGTIVSDPVAGTYDEGTSITVTATPNTGWHFVKWSNESTTNPLIFNLTEDVTISAVFEEDAAQYTFALQQTTGGTISSTPAPGTYDAGTSVEVTATPESGYKFVKWSNNSTANPLIFTLTADVTISAVFQEEGAAPSNYSIAWSVEGLGEIESSYPAGTYEEGTSITLTAKPATDWELDEWVINGIASGKTNPLTITLTENTTVVAKFITNKEYKVTIKVHKDGGGTVEPKNYDKKLVKGGTSLAIKAIPDDDYKFVEWKEDGETDEERTIVITQDTVLTAVFEEITYYRLTVEVDPEEGGTVLFDGKAVSKMYKDYAEGTIVKLTAQAEDGYEFVQFEDGKDEITTEEYKVKVDKKKTVYAIFKKKQQGLDGVQSTEDRVQKLLINGEIYILRGEKVYTVQGQVVK